MTGKNTRLNANLRDEARGQPCMVRLPGCDFGGETSVLAHVRRSGNSGGAMKPPDITGVIACDPCHLKIGDRGTGYEAELLDAICRTHDHWKRLGLIA